MILDVFAEIKVKKTGETFSVHKPLLLLTALARCFHDKERLDSYLSYEHEIYAFKEYFGNPLSNIHLGGW